MKPLISTTVLICVLMLTLTSFAQNREFRVYSLGFISPAVAEEAVQAALGPDGKVTIDVTTNRLIVYGTPKEHQEIEQLLKTLNVPASQVRIDVAISEQTLGKESGIQLESRGTLNIKSIGKSNLWFKPKIQSSKTKETTHSTQTLLVSSGYEGELAVGERVPYLEWLMVYGMQKKYLFARLQWNRVGSRLVVKPTVVGDGSHIRIQATPQLSGFVLGKPHHVRFVDMTTEVTVKDGETVVLGTANQNHEFYSRFLVGYNRAQRQTSLSIHLTPHIVRR